MAVGTRQPGDVSSAGTPPEDGLGVRLEPEPASRVTIREPCVQGSGRRWSYDKA